MSSIVVAHVWGLPTPKGAHRLVLLAIADCASADGRTPGLSAPTIARLTGYSEREVRRLLADLLRRKIVFVEAKSHPKAGIAYRIPVPWIDDPYPVGDVTVSDDATLLEMTGYESEATPEPPSTLLDLTGYAPEKPDLDTESESGVVSAIDVDDVGERGGPGGAWGRPPVEMPHGPREEDESQAKGSEDEKTEERTEERPALELTSPGVQNSSRRKRTVLELDSSMRNNCMEKAGVPAHLRAEADEQIELALSWANAKKYTRLDLYVASWLRRWLDGVPRWKREGGSRNGRASTTVFGATASPYSEVGLAYGDD